MTPQNDPLATVSWVAAADNPFGVELLNCCEYSQSMLALSANPAVAESFVLLRNSDGAQHRGKTPERAVTLECTPQYPHMGAPKDGPLFKAETMEDKWDIYLYEGELYFARSWTGSLEYCAAIETTDAAAKLVAITARQEVLGEGDAYPIAVVDFLIRSHVYRQTVPHPLVKALGRDTRKLGLFSFVHYGRHGLYGTFADTTKLQGQPSTA